MCQEIRLDDLEDDAREFAAGELLRMEIASDTEEDCEGLEEGPKQDFSAVVNGETGKPSPKPKKVSGLMF